MPICPKCSSVIDRLNFTRTTTDYGAYTVGSNGEEDFDVEDDGGGTISLRCPECDEVLFRLENKPDDYAFPSTEHIVKFMGASE
jgi:hypothetical protein